MSPLQICIRSSLQITREHSSKWRSDKEKRNPTRHLARLIPRTDDIDDASEGARLADPDEEAHCVYCIQILRPSTAECEQSPSDFQGWQRDVDPRAR